MVSVSRAVWLYEVFTRPLLQMGGVASLPPVVG
jgi:hypothetical protein